MAESDRSQVPVPEEFFLQLLPRIGDLAELKLALHVLEISHRRGTSGAPLRDLLTSTVLHSVAGAPSPEPAEIRLRRALDRAVANGTLLRLTVRDPEGTSQIFFLSTAENRALLDSLRRGEPQSAERLGMSSDAELSVYRPNVFALYEQHIGPLTALIAEQLRDAERSYPRGWVEEAIVQAARHSRHSWRYIEAILSRWEEAGGPDRVSGRRA